MSEQIVYHAAEPILATLSPRRRNRDEERRDKRWFYVRAEMSDPTYLALVRGHRDVSETELAGWRKRSAERLKNVFRRDLGD